VLGVGDGVPDDALEEGLEDTAGLFVDHWRHTLLGNCRVSAVSGV
jgi:hypothetical protein